MTELRRVIITKSDNVNSPDAARILTVVNLCTELQAFPRQGGLYDQDSLFVSFLTNILMWKQERAELDERKRANAR